MLYREIIAVCSEIHIRHTNTLCGQNVELLNVNTLRTGSFKLFKRPLPVFLTILTL